MGPSYKQLRDAEMDIQIRLVDAERGDMVVVKNEDGTYSVLCQNMGFNGGVWDEDELTFKTLAEAVESLSFTLALNVKNDFYSEEL